MDDGSPIHLTVTINEQEVLENLDLVHIISAFCYGYGYRPHVYDENGARKRNFRKRSLEWIVLKTIPRRIGVDACKRNFSITMSRL